MSGPNATPSAGEMLAAKDAEIARLQKENARLGEALADYGQHYESCPRWKHLVRAICDCGFSAALQGEEVT